jgi:hypothetical protein
MGAPQGKILFVEDAEELLAQQYGPEATVKIDRSFFADNTGKCWRLVSGCVCVGVFGK